MAEIKIVTIDELRQMNDQEGLILQGCGCLLYTSDAADE